MIDESFQKLTLAAAPHRPKFKQPMSRKAKRLLEGMLGWAASTSKCYPNKLWNTQDGFWNAFYATFDPLTYEDVCHRFKIDSHLTALKKPSANLFPGTIKTQQDVLDTMCLQHFNNNTWLRENKIDDNERRIKSLSTPEVQEVYGWLTANFLITDFTEDDLNKVAMMGDEKYSLDLVQREAGKIRDIDKRTIPYLYAIVRDAAIRDGYAREQAAKVQSVQDKKLQSIIEFGISCQNKSIHKFDPDMRSEWERSREFIDILRDLKKDHE